MEMVVVNAMFLATVFPKTEVTMYERMLKCWMNGNQFVSNASGLITSMTVQGQHGDVSCFPLF